MPEPDALGREAAFLQALDRTPKTEDEHARIIRWVDQAFQAARQARQPLEERWRRYYKLFRSYNPRLRGDWHSNVFVPICFWVVETVVPRLVSQLPKFLVLGVEESDVGGAERMERLIDWAAKRSEVYLELTKAYKSAAKYGTGILKTSYQIIERTKRSFVPKMEPEFETVSEPELDPTTGQPLLDLDGQPIMSTREIQVGERENGFRLQREQLPLYDGPVGEWVDIFNFWPSPEATDVDDARYVIQRVYKDQRYVKQLLEEGVFHLPPGMKLGDTIGPEEDPSADRMASVGLGNSPRDPTRKLVELLEIWTDDACITVGNGKAVLRVAENPYAHGEKHFIRIVDHLNEGEFWGTGEIEPLEGLQDAYNVTLNQRRDNVRLVLNRMFMVNVDDLFDPRDLQVRPGGAIRVRGSGTDPSQVVRPMDFGDITASAYEETDALERIIERVSAVTPVQLGQMSPSVSDTATGMALLQGAGDMRFAHKVKVSELTGLTRLARHYGTLIDQYWPEQRQVRLVGPEGNPDYQTIAKADIAGSYDYEVEARSSSLNEQVKQNQALSLFHELAGVVGINIQKLVQDVLESFDIKDKQAYFAPLPAPVPGIPGLPGQEMLPQNGQQLPPDLMAALGPAPATPMPS